MGSDLSNPQPDSMPTLPMAPGFSPPSGSVQSESPPPTETIPVNPLTTQAGSVLARPVHTTTPPEQTSTPTLLQQAPAQPFTPDPNLSHSANTAPKTFAPPKSLIILALTAGVLVLGYWLISGPLQSFLQRSSTSESSQGAVELAPNPTCDKPCQANLDCEGRAGGKSVRLECVKESGSSVGKCRNPLCASTVSCTCPSVVAPASE